MVGGRFQADGDGDMNEWGKSTGTSVTLWEWICIVFFQVAFYVSNILDDIIGLCAKCI